MIANVRLSAVLSGWLLAASAWAGGTDRLNAFMNDTRSAKSEFSQRIVDRSGKVTQESRGTLEFARPGKFRWTYVKPYNQLIVGDGSKVWIYDPDLNQVSIRKIDAALGSTPAALLSGNNDAMKAFVLKDEGTRDGLEWVLATPRQKEANFERIRIGFSKEGLAAMELTDAFGQQTVLKFLTMERNPRIDPSTFQFTPPKGADVIGE
ncbi:MAG: outer membrane lipoprotein chaperone LolA [Burkholderiales bacterium]